MYAPALDLICGHGTPVENTSEVVGTVVMDNVVQKKPLVAIHKLQIPVLPRDTTPAIRPRNTRYKTRCAVKGENNGMYKVKR